MPSTYIHIHLSDQSVYKEITAIQKYFTAEKLLAFLFVDKLKKASDRTHDSWLHFFLFENNISVATIKKRSLKKGVHLYL